MTGVKQTEPKIYFEKYANGSLGIAARSNRTMGTHKVNLHTFDLAVKLVAVT